MCIDHGQMDSCVLCKLSSSYVVPYYTIFNLSVTDKTFLIMCSLLDCFFSDVPICSMDIIVFDLGGWGFGVWCVLFVPYCLCFVFCFTVAVCAVTVAVSVAVAQWCVLVTTAWGC